MAHFHLNGNQELAIAIQIEKMNAVKIQSYKLYNGSTILSKSYSILWNGEFFHWSLFVFCFLFPFFLSIFSTAKGFLLIHSIYVMNEWMNFITYHPFYWITLLNQLKYRRFSLHYQFGKSFERENIAVENNS